MFRRLFLASLVAAVAARALNDRPALIAQGIGHDYHTAQSQWQAELDSQASAEHAIGLSVGGHHPQPPHHFPADNHPQPPGPPKFPHPPPHFPGHHPPKSSNGTIYSTLRESPEFSRLFKVVNISDQIVALLNDSSKNLTFFALPNHAIPHPPPHHRSPRDLKLDSVQAGLSLVDLIYHLESIQIEDNTSRRPSEEEVKKIVTAILSYHTIPSRLDISSLKKNSTYPTTLSHVFGALNDNALRLHVGAALPFARVNFYSGIVRPDIGTENGIIHAVNHPLLPPPSVFQSIFLFQDAFATFSSVVQRTNVTNALDFKFVHESDAGLAATEGSPVVTVFAPTNKAFANLPRKLKFFLFSPYGEHVLKKLVQYHVVPEIAFYSDWLLNSTSETDLEDFDVASVLTDEDWTALEPVLGPLEHDCTSGSSMLSENHPLPPCGLCEEDSSERTRLPPYGRFGLNQFAPDDHPPPHHPPPSPHQPPPPPHHPPPPPHHAPPPPPHHPPPPPPHHPPPPPPHHPPPPPPHHPPPPPPHHPPPPPPHHPPPPPPHHAPPPPPHHAPPPPPHHPPPPPPHHPPPPPHHAPPPPPHHPPHHHPSLPKPKLLANLTLPTAFEGHSLNALVVRIPFKSPIPGHHEEFGHITKVIVNGQPVIAYDGPALNGALHVVNKLISPRRGRKRPEGNPRHSFMWRDSAGRDVEEQEDDWEDWEDWLPAWAEE